MRNTATVRWIIKPWGDLLMLYGPFRLLTCVPPVVALLIQEMPEKHLQFGPWLIAYAFALSIAVSAAYIVIFRSQ